MPHTLSQPGLTIRLGSHSMRLLASRGVLWNDALLIADTHLGKAEALASVGIPIPSNVSDATLEAISLAWRQCGASRLIVLGDLLHAPAGITLELIDAVAQWRSAHVGEVLVVRGNHDRKIEPLARAANFTLLEPGTIVDGLCLRHEPARAINGVPVVFGHVHPMVGLGKGRLRARLACFVETESTLMLPAFGKLTGGVCVVPDARTRVHAIADGQVLTLSRAQAAPRGA